MKEITLFVASVLLILLAWALAIGSTVAHYQDCRRVLGHGALYCATLGLK